MKPNDQNFTKLPVKDLAKKIISDGHVFLSAGEKKFYLMKPGMLVDPTFIKKLAINNPILEFDLVVNLEVKEKFKSLFRELRYLQFEKDLKQKNLEIVQYFHEFYSGEGHFLTFAMACYEEFCQLPADDQLRLHEADINLFRKALYSSAFSIILGMANEFYHFLMLRDFYTLTFTLDIGLCEPNYSYFVAEACNKENLNPGSGKNYMTSEKASQLEIDVFLKHPERSYHFLKNAGILSHPELMEVILYQHELSDGSGFPRGVTKGQISSWEAVVIFADSLVDIASECKFEQGVVSYLVNFQSQKLNDLPIKKVYQKLCSVFEHFNDKKEIVS